MADSYPLITVLMPVFNASSFVKEAIDSILAQTYSNFEFLIIDDGSTDESIEIVKSYTDKRIIFYQNHKNLGLVNTLNKGLSLASSDFIARMDADDIASPNRLEKQYDFLKNNPDFGILGTAFESFGKINKKVYYQTNHYEIKWKQLFECHMLHPSVMLRKHILNLNDLSYNKNFKYAQDYELWAKASQVTKLANLNEVLMRYRQSDNNISHKYNDIQEANSLKIRKYLFAQLGINIGNHELELFKQTAYHQYIASRPSVESLEQLLFKIWNANKQSHYFPQKFLEKNIGDMWFHTCTNCSSLGKWVHTKFHQSPLSKLYLPSINEKVKFYIKCLFKK